MIRNKNQEININVTQSNFGSSSSVLKPTGHKKYFPEINFDKVETIRGLDITIVTTSKKIEDTIFLLKEFNFPIIKDTTKKKKKYKKIIDKEEKKENN